MTVYTKYYHPQPGAWFIVDAALTLVQILTVARNDRVLSETANDEAVGLQFVYNRNLGQILFDQNVPFTEGPIIIGEEGGFNVTALEKVLVKYQV